LKFDADKIKNFTYGLMLIISFIGGIYGSFKTETDARESHESLAPVVDQTTDILSSHNERLLKLEIQNDIYKSLLFESVGCTEKQVLTPKLKKVKISEPPPEPQSPSVEVKPKIKKLRSPAPNVQQRQKTRWELKSK